MTLQGPHECDAVINDVQKLLMSGSFYFPVSSSEDGQFILSSSSQKQKLRPESSDGRFFW